jgi:hypothetical protein
MEFLKQKKQFLFTNGNKTNSSQDLEKLKALREKIEKSQNGGQPLPPSFDDYETFDWKRYLKTYDDLVENGMQSKKDAWFHWRNHGKAEGRVYFKLDEEEGLSSPQSEYAVFDWVKYLNFYEDLRSSEMRTKDEAYKHWTNHGKQENRQFFKVEQTNSQPVKKSKPSDVLTDKDKEKEKEKEKGKEKEKEKKDKLRKGNENVKIQIDDEDDIEEDERHHAEKRRKQEENIPKWEENFDDTENLDLELEELKKQNSSEALSEKDLINKEGLQTMSKKLDNYAELIKNYDPEAVTYENFDWRSYVQNYKDLASLDSKKKAWVHWTSSGKSEKRVTYNLDIKEAISYIDLKLKAAQNPLKNRVDVDLKFKQIYDNYGNHYFGWKKIINMFIVSFLKEYENKPFKMSKQTLFDEWLEKLLLWGNKIQREQTLDCLNEKDYNLITFVHNPPYDKYLDANYKTSVKNSVILTDEEMLNRNLFRKMYQSKLHQKTTYLCTLSNYHKQYICHHYPFFKNKLISTYHPIEIKTPLHLMFDMDRFLDRRNIVHIGWWLRNFKSFVDFQVHESFKKMIIVKNDFQESWTAFSQNLRLNDIDVYEELDEERYENIMRSSCIFVDLEDCVANNTVLECIKFNTPIITRRNPNLEEYLGYDYPLFFDTEEDLMVLLDENVLLTQIEKAYIYLRDMDKSHVSLECFNKKLMYDLKKLEVREDTSSPKLTWCCILDKPFTLEHLEKILLMFNNQTDNENVEIRFFTTDKVYSDIICVNVALNRFLRILLRKTGNKELVLLDDRHLLEQIKEAVHSDYILFVDANDIYHQDFSIKAMKFLEKHPTSDIVISSFHKSNGEEVIFKSSELLFLSSVHEKEFYRGSFVIRRAMLELLQLSNYNIKMMEDFMYKCIMNHFNVFCFSENKDMLQVYTNSDALVKKQELEVETKESI